MYSKLSCTGAGQVDPLIAYQMFHDTQQRWQIKLHARGHILARFVSFKDLLSSCH